MYAQLFQIQANLLKAIAHPRRLEIIHLLRDQELPVGEIHAMLDLPQANISQHLTVLRDAQIVTAKRKGKSKLYKLTDSRVISACDQLREVLLDRQECKQLAETMTHSMQDLVPLTTDPVCQMRVSPKTAGSHLKYNDADIYFCASGCLSAFKKSPSTYV